jgi:hypothetical protein
LLVSFFNPEDESKCSSSMMINYYRLQSIKSQKTLCFTDNTMIITNLVLIRNVSDKILQPNTWPGATEGLRAGLNMLRQAKYDE